MMVAFRVGNFEDVKGIPTDFPKCGNWRGSGSSSTSSSSICRTRYFQNVLLAVLSLHAIYISALGQPCSYEWGAVYQANLFRKNFRTKMQTSRFTLKHLSILKLNLALLDAQAFI